MSGRAVTNIIGRVHLVFLPLNLQVEPVRVLLLDFGRQDKLVRALILEYSLNLSHVGKVRFEKHEVCSVTHHDELFDVLLVLGLEQAVLVLHALGQGVDHLSDYPWLSDASVYPKELVVRKWIRSIWLQELVDEMPH